LVELTADGDDPLEDGDRGEDRDEGEGTREDERAGGRTVEAAEVAAASRVTPRMPAIARPAARRTRRSERGATPTSPRMPTTSALARA
jgi:hypothetical protein